jgi:small redox-active disulfide protein 2
MEIIVLGAGCTACNNVYSAVEKVIAEAGIDANLHKEEDIVKILEYNLMAPPAVVVDGVVKLQGMIPSEVEIKKMLGIV